MDGNGSGSLPHHTVGYKGLEHWDLGVHEVLEPAHRKYPELTVCWHVSLIF